MNFFFFRKHHPLIQENVPNQSHTQLLSAGQTIELMVRVGGGNLIFSGGDEFPSVMEVLKGNASFYGFDWLRMLGERSIRSQSMERQPEKL
jgi:hypothetical protein